ncbi:MAG: 50S ribosomal protein L31e [Cuniculiplasma sp.]
MADDSVNDEILMNIPLRKAFNSSKRRRADTAIKIIRESVARYTKSELDNVWIDSKINEEIWKRGKFKIPTSIQVKVLKLQNDEIEVLIP